MTDIKSDFVETKHYDESDDRLIVKKTYDNTDVLKQNHEERVAKPEHQKYKGNFVKVGSLHKGDVERLINMGYNILSPDPEEHKRALLYIQQNEPHLLTVNGKPFSKKKSVWV